MRKLILLLALLLPLPASGAMTTHGLGSVTDGKLCRWENSTQTIECDQLIGAQVQAWDAELAWIGALTETNGAVMFVAGGAWAADLTPAIDCSDCTGIPAAALLSDVGDVTVTALADFHFLIRDQSTDTDWENVLLSGDVASVSLAGAVAIAATHSGTPHHSVFTPNATTATDHTNFNADVDARVPGAETNDLSSVVTWANVPDANVAGVDERDEVCGTTDLSAACEVNATHSGTPHHAVFTPTAGLSTDHGATAVGDTDIADGAVDGGAGGEIADGSIVAADVAASLDTLSTQIPVMNPNAATGEFIVMLPPVTGTMTEVYCEVFGGTNVVINICDGEDLGDDTCTVSIFDAVAATTLTCDLDGETDSSLNATGYVAKDKLSLVLVSESGTVDQLSVYITSTVD